MSTLDPGGDLKMTYMNATREFWEGLEIGSSAGAYEYELTQEMLDDYRHVVGDPDAAYPTVAARHGQRMFQQHFASAPGLTNAGIEARYLRPPHLGRIRVEGRIADGYERRGKLYVAIEARAFDVSDDAEPFEVTRLIGLLQGMSGMTAHE